MVYVPSSYLPVTEIIWIEEPSSSICTLGLKLLLNAMVQVLEEIKVIIS